MTVTIAERIRRIRWFVTGAARFRTNGKPTNGVGKNVERSRAGKALERRKAPAAATALPNRADSAVFDSGVHPRLPALLFLFGIPLVTAISRKFSPSS